MENRSSLNGPLTFYFKQRHKALTPKLAPQFIVSKFIHSKQNMEERDTNRYILFPKLSRITMQLLVVLGNKFIIERDKKLNSSYQLIIA